MDRGDLRVTVSKNEIDSGYENVVFSMVFNCFPEDSEYKKVRTIAGQGRFKIDPLCSKLDRKRQSMEGQGVNLLGI